LSPKLSLPMGCKPTGLHERLSRPKHNPQRIATERRAYAPACRRQGLVYADIAQRTGLLEATLSRVLGTVPRHSQHRSCATNAPRLVSSSISTI
jgi:hypothetical protein